VKARIAALAAVAVAAAGANASAGGPQFTTRVTNPWFPLRPGMRWVYTGVKDGKPSRDVMQVTRRTRTIAGAPCVGVSDRLWLHGKLEERTTDWYTQDFRGNVWYFGEETAELDARGHVTSTEGSWQAGRDGARAGLFMPAHPRVGQSARQEYWKGHAEDHFRVLAVPGGKVVLTKEWTPLEPGVVDHKLYVRGVGDVLEQTIRGGDERNELVSFTP
jgi:hypothetical protein